MVNTECDAVWQERVERWRASRLSRSAFALREGYPIRQVGCWLRRLTRSPAAPGLLPVRVTLAPPVPVAISLINERGWTLSLPSDVPASWLAELMRAL